MPRTQKRTLRRMNPLEREAAEIMNELDRLSRRVRRFMPKIHEAERIAQAVRRMEQVAASPDAPGSFGERTAAHAAGFLARLEKAE